MTVSAAPASASRRTQTFSALRNANFRLYFGGQLVSASGTWMQNVAQGYLVFQLTHSELWLGIVACAAGLPLVLLSPVAGVIVERRPRRVVMLFTQTAQMLLAFILAALTFANAVQVWHIVTLAFLLGVSNALDAPARLTLIVEMVGREELQSGITLNSMLNSGSRVLGPAAAGAALVLIGPSWCFFINGLSFLAVIVSLLIMQVPYAIDHGAHVAPLQQLKEGLNYARRHELIAPLLLLTAVASWFGVTIVAQMPAFAAVVLGSPKEGYAALTTGQGIGSVLSGFVFGWLTWRLGRGRLTAVVVLMAALATYLFSRMTSIPMASFFSALSGFLLVTEMVGINTSIQSLVSDQFRGRVLALYTVAFFGMAPFGSLALGALADRIGVQDAVAVYAIVGGLFGVFVYVRWPGLLRER